MGKEKNEEDFGGTIICPFLSMVMKGHEKPYHFCIEEHCGIWNHSEKRCSIRMISENIKEVL